MTSTAPPDVLRAAYAELVVSDLRRSCDFYVDVLGMTISSDDGTTVCLRTTEEFIHHNLVLRQGPLPALAALAYRVRRPSDIDAAEKYFTELGCVVQRRRDGFTPGVGDSVRVQDPLGFTSEFFHLVEHVDRLIWKHHLHAPTALARLDHFNLVVPDVAAGCEFLGGLGFKLTEQITDEDEVSYAAWLGRKQTVHDTALTAGEGPRLHHIAFAVTDAGDVLTLCDRIGALRHAGLIDPSTIERGPGRHGVSHACYVYLRDPDGHRIEIYTHDYYTGDPDNPVVTWDVHDEQRRDWWGNPVVPSWYSEASTVLDLAGVPLRLREPVDLTESDLQVGADGFTVHEDHGEGKLGHQL